MTKKMPEIFKKTETFPQELLISLISQTYPEVIFII